MKNTISLVILLFILIFNLNAQTLSKEERLKNLQSTKEYENSIKLGQTGRNELNINLLTPLWGSIELNYERILNENSSYGIAGNLGISKDYYNSSFLLGFYRIYFGKKINNGFFIEANSGFSSIEEGYGHIDYYSSYQNSYSTDRYNGLGVGVAIGYKLLAKNGVVCQIFGGLGRNFGSNYDHYTPIFPRSGITIGKRFGK